MRRIYCGLGALSLAFCAALPAHAADARPAQAATWVKQGFLLNTRESPKVPGDMWVSVSRKFVLLPLEKQATIAETFCGLLRDGSIALDRDPIVSECRFVFGSLDIGAVDFVNADDGETVVPDVTWEAGYETEQRRREFARAK